MERTHTPFPAKRRGFCGNCCFGRRQKAHYRKRRTFLNILAIDTSGTSLSLALSFPDGQVFSETDATLRHSELLLDQIDAILRTAGLKPSDLDAVGCMKGPGSFTGLRIAWAAAKGLSLALGIPILSAPTLDCLALPFFTWPACVMPIIDAKKNRFFAALYKGGRRLSEYLDEDAQSLEKRLQSAADEKSPILLTGPGAGLLHAKLSLKISKKCTIDRFIRKGKAIELLELICKYDIVNNKEDIFSGPLYLRKSDAELNFRKTNETLDVKNMNETDAAQENITEEGCDTIEELEEGVDDLEALDLIEETSDDEKERTSAVLLPAFAPFMHSVFPVLLINKKMKILFANDSCQRLFSELFELPENHFIDIFGRAFEINELREIRETILGAREGNSWKGKARIRHRNVATIQTRVYIFPAILSEAEPSEYVVMFDDVTEENRQLLRSVFLSLLEASKLKDNDTGKHILRVNKYALRMAQELFKSKNPKYNRIDQDFIDSIGFLASMHDVGKIGTPDDILNKEGPLSDWELSIMREHTKNGAFILSTYPDPMAKEIALSHHERWDGLGYPYQLSGEMIPLAARITTIADVYDALRMARSYKPALSHEVTFQKMIEGKNSHFDPFLLDIFSEIAKDFENIYETNKDG